MCQYSMWIRSPILLDPVQVQFFGFFVFVLRASLLSFQGIVLLHSFLSIFRGKMYKLLFPPSSTARPSFQANRRFSWLLRTPLFERGHYLCNQSPAVGL